jgi:hypothetical protein
MYGARLSARALLFRGMLLGCTRVAGIKLGYVLHLECHSLTRTIVMAGWGHAGYSLTRTIVMAGWGHAGHSLTRTIVMCVTTLKASTLTHYGSIFITEPNLPQASLDGILTWVKEESNRTLLLSPFAGQFDQYNQPSTRLLAETGVSHPLTATNYYGAVPLSVSLSLSRSLSLSLPEQIVGSAALADHAFRHHAEGQRWVVVSEGACYNPQNSWWCAVQNGSASGRDTLLDFTAWGVWGDLVR